MTPQKKKIRRALESFVEKHLPDDEVAVLLSGGADSTVVALCAHHLGRKVVAISFRLAGFKSWDFETARKTAKAMGWKFEEVVVPADEPSKYFRSLIEENGCRKKTEVEVLYPFLFILQRLQRLGFRKVLTGFSSPLPDSRQKSIDCQKDPEGFWQSLIGKEFDSTATQKCFETARRGGVDLMQPLNQDAIKKALVGTTTKEVNSPYHKHHWKDLYREDFDRLGLLPKGLTPSLQTGGSIESFFERVLDDPEINPGGRKEGDAKRQLSALCLRWSKRKRSRPVKSGAASVPNVPATPYSSYSVRDVLKAGSRNLFTVVSTFAGGGGSSTGYRLAGGKVIFANEFIDEAVNTYRLNYPDTPIVHEDIRKFNHGQANVVKLFKEFGIGEGELDIFDGSPPCATFSKASGGKGKDKIDKKDVAYSDTRQNRVGMLIHDYVFMANVMKPKVCIMENVPEISKSPVFHYALQRLERYNYIVSFKKLVATDYGVPQRRERLFVIAVRPDVARAAGIEGANDVLNIFPSRSTPTYTIREALAGLKVDAQEREMLLTMNRKSAAYELTKALPKNPSKHMRMSDIDPDWKSDFSLTRAAWNLPSPTITATGAAGRGGILHPEEDRGFTLAELKRLSGLPDDFRLSGQFAQRAERIGRMVPPLMTKAIAEAVYKNILSKS